MDAANNQGMVPARYISHLANALRQQGVDVPALLQVADVEQRTLASPDALLTLPQLDILRAEAVKITGRSDLALEMGKTIRLSNHSIVGYGILSSPNLAYALQLASRYFSLILPAFRLTLQRNGDSANLGYEPIQPIGHKTLEFLLEVLSVATLLDIEELLGNKLSGSELFLSIDEPAHAERYSSLLRTKVHFGHSPLQAGAPGLTLRFPANYLQEKPAQADRSALNMAEERCRSLVQRSVSAGNIGDWVRMMLRESRGGMPDMTELARSQNLSPRTLDRYLKREGSGFRDILKTERQRKAKRLLSKTRQDITEIAYELGYNDPANFTRAFRRETGISPSAYRDKISQHEQSN